ncbi:MAG: DUF308 domain-containing protein [Acutalibacteraceae bacterium]|jgi:uncharacterized membrane protein HdeD (DUF308 family)
MKTRSITPMWIAKAGYIVLSAALCAAGIAMMILPETSLVVMGRVLGILMMVFGAVKLVGYFSKDLYRLAFQYDLELGILLLVLGMILLIRPIGAISFFCVALGIGILVDALFKIRIAFDAKRFGIPAWWSILLLAIAAGIIGLLLILRPWESTAALAVLLGISLLAEGILNFCVAISAVKIVHNQIPDQIEGESFEAEEEDR